MDGSKLISKRPLGTTGIDVSHLGLGTVKMGRNKGVKYPRNFQLPSDVEITKLLNVAQDLGINLIDTAPAYGTSETRLGIALTDNRSDWIICTKVGETFYEGTSKFDFTPEAVQLSVANSLKKLQTDYLDIVLIHSNDDDIPLLTSIGTLDVLLELKTKGIIRAVGISSKTVAGAEAALDRCDVIMATLNSHYLDERPVIAQAGEQGVGVLVKKALSSGHGKIADLSFAANQPGVSSVVVGTLNPEHLAQNCGALSHGALAT